MYPLRAELKSGFQLVIYPKLPDSPYTAMRGHTRDFLDKDVPVIDAPDDMDDLIRLLEPYSIVCVLAGSEYGVAMADELAERLGLPGNPPETSFMRLQKSAMQEALKHAGIRYIRSRTVTTEEEAEDFWKELGVKRVVLKPLASAGTLGVHFCTTREELKQYMEELLSDQDLFGRDIREILIQEYIDGTEYIVNTASCGGIHRMTDLWMYHKVAIGSEGNAYDYARLITHLEPGHRELIEYAYQVLDALGYQYGPSERLLPYCPAMEMMIKYFIAPKAQKVLTFPALAVLKHLKSFRRVNFSEVIESGALEKTVDLISAPAFLQLCHADPKVLMQDYQTIRSIEQKYFGLLFAENTGVRTSLDFGEVMEDYRSLPEGRRFVLLDYESECRELRSMGVTAVTVEELHDLPGERSGGIFALSSDLGLEECLGCPQAALIAGTEKRIRTDIVATTCKTGGGD